MEYPKFPAAYKHFDKIRTGEGGATVYQATCTFLDGSYDVVAVKKFATARDVEVFEGVSHRNINSPVCCFFVEEEGVWWAVMPFVTGCSMQEIMAANPQGLPEKMVATLLREVLSGIAYLHSKNLIHMDLKPSNIFCDFDGNVRISDIGISMSYYRQDFREWSNCPYWTAPENPSSSLDVYGLGILVMELAYGGPPITSLIERKRFSLSLKKFVGCCLNENPMKRPKAEELLSHPFLKRCCDASEIRVLVDSISDNGPVFENRSSPAIKRWRFCENEFELVPIIDGQGGQGGEIGGGQQQLYIESATGLFLDQPSLLGYKEFTEFARTDQTGDRMVMFFRHSLRSINELELNFTELSLAFLDSHILTQSEDVDSVRVASCMTELADLCRSVGSKKLEKIIGVLRTSYDEDNVKKCLKCISLFKTELESARKKLKTFMELERVIVDSGGVPPTF